MIHTLAQRRPVVLGLFFATLIVLIQARPITNRYLASLGLHWGTKPLVMQPIAAIETKKIESHIRRKAVVYTDFTGVSLRSTARSYQVAVNGHLASAEALSGVTVELTLLTDRNTEIHRTESVQSNGSFELRVPLTEYQHAQMDWRLVARRSGDIIGESHGRRILTEEADVEISAPVLSR